MTDADELSYLRPRVSQLEHALACERRHHHVTQDLLSAARAQAEALSAELRRVRTTSETVRLDKP
jgi:hypothetical protein